MENNSIDVSTNSLKNLRKNKTKRAGKGRRKS